MEKNLSFLEARQAPDLIENALKNRHLSENSIDLYKRNLLKLNDNKPIKKFFFKEIKKEL